MAYDFSTGTQFDIIFHTGNNKSLLGYAHIPNLPVMMWLYALQVSKKDILNDISLPVSDPQHIDLMDSMELEELVENSIQVAKALPLSVSEFNIRTNLADVAWYSSGTHPYTYRFILRDDNLLVLEKDRLSPGNDPIHIISPDDAEIIVGKYMGYVMDKLNGSTYPPMVIQVIKSLKELHL